jgi:hypothetical protein
VVEDLDFYKCHRRFACWAYCLFTKTQNAMNMELVSMLATRTFELTPRFSCLENYLHSGNFNQYNT